MFIFFASPFPLYPLAFPKRNKLINLRNFFLTFTDALLCIINEYKISKKDIILMPNHYCPSTLKHISDHFQVKFYKINDDFSVNKDDYFNKIREYKPRAILNYSYIGFNLNENEKLLLKDLCSEETIIIDDSAHKILNESELTFINKHHFYINSCRKHSAFLGSHLINPNFRYSSKNIDYINRYKVKLSILQFIDETLGLFTYIFSSRFLYDLEEKVFLWSDSISGTSKHSTKGNAIDYFLYNCISFKKVRNHNKNMILYYNESFASLESQLIQTISKDAQPNYYPLLIDKKYLTNTIDYFKKNNIFADRLWESDELPDEFRGETNTYLYDSLIVLPLTWLIKRKHIDYITKILKNSLEDQTNC
jgi:hypothetical protein